MSILNKKSFFAKILITFIIILGIIETISMAATVNPTSDFYVNDYAGLLNEETKNYIISTNKSLYNQTGSQIVVVTIPSLNGNSLEDYSTELFRNFGIGSKSKNNGVLLLLALEERQFRIEVGYGLEGILPDGKTGRIQDEYIIPYLKQNNWNDGIKNGYSAILNIVADEYNVNVGAEDAIVTEDTNNSIFDSIEFMGIPFISLIVGTRTRARRKKNKHIIFSIVYMAIVSIFYYIVNINEITLAIFGILFNFIFFISGLISNSNYIGGRTVFLAEASLVGEVLSEEEVHPEAAEVQEAFNKKSVNSGCFEFTLFLLYNEYWDGCEVHLNITLSFL